MPIFRGGWNEFSVYEEFADKCHSEIEIAIKSWLDSRSAFTPPENGCFNVNRSLTLMVALVAVASQWLTLPIQAAEPTPASRQSTRNVASREGKSSQPVGSGVNRKASQQVAAPNANQSQNQVRQASATSRRPSGSGVAQANHIISIQKSDPVLQPGEYIVDEGAPMVEGAASCDSCGVGSCDGSTCGSPARTNWGYDLCNPGRGSKQLVLCLPSHGWVQMDYLMMWQRGMNIPPLLTSQPNATTAPTLILGNEDIMDGRLNGGRLRFGWWFANNPNLSIEGEYLGIGKSEYAFERAAVGTPILARPFFNTQTGNEDAELISNTGLSGRFNVTGTSQFDGAAVRFKRLLCCSSGCGCSPVNCGPVPTQSRIDATLGWRFFQLKEGLSITETLLETGPNRSYLINDSFETRNQFNGVELGVQWQGRRGYWSCDSLMRLSLGNNLQTVEIDGSTLINNQTPAGPAGGFLAQRSNIGTYTAETFAVVPELGINLGYQLTPRWRANAGYNFIYWSSVARPGDQIDTDLNPNQIPPATVGTSIINRPSFTLTQSDYWIQGVNLGLEYHW